MSIQSNINQGINQATLLAQLSPGIQSATETRRKRRELDRTEQQLVKLQGKQLEGYKSDELAIAPVFQSEATKDYYNKLLDRQQDLSVYMWSVGKKGGRSFEKAMTEAEFWGPIQKAKADAQRQRVAAIQKQKAEEAARSKQIRDLIMNPNLEVNNGTGNDTRR